MSLVVATLAWISFGNAREFGRRAFEIAAPARAAVAAVNGFAVPEGNCHIAFLGYEPPPEWSIYVSMDSIVKALAADKSILHCWIHSNLPTFTHLQSLGASEADALPFPTLWNDGRQVPWHRIGHVIYAYLTAPPDLAPARSHTTFFAMQNGRFVDVSARVAAGEIPAKLQ